MDKERKENSYELQGVLDYMVDILGKEFPTNIYTPEHLMAAILDTKRCHANMILDNCLMSGNMNELRQIYASVLSSKTPYITNNSDKPIFDAELTNILDNAAIESDRIGSINIGTEHVLLSILNPNNGFSIMEVLKSMGVDYNFIFNKCRTNKDRNNNNNRIRTPNKKVNIMDVGDIPSKSGFENKAQFSTVPTNEFIEKYTINISKLVKEGKTDKIIGRDSEARMVITALSRRKKNNAVLVGNGGVGKTSIIYKLAEMMENGDAGETLSNKEIVGLDIMSLVSGTHFRGMFEERIKGVIDELKSNTKYILFLDDIHTMLKSNTKEKDTDISGMIGEILGGGDVQVIATTTNKDYRTTIESNPSIKNKMQKILVESVSRQQCIEILNANKKYYETFHNVKYDNGTIEKCVGLAERYISDRSLPDSAFDVLDIAGANVNSANINNPDVILIKKQLYDIRDKKEEHMNNGEFELLDEVVEQEKMLEGKLTEIKKSYQVQGSNTVTLDDISATVSQITSIPIQKLSANEKKKIAEINDVLKRSIVGQDEAIDDVCRIIKRNKVGLGEKKHRSGVLLFLGQSGTGKTLLAKKLAEEIFGDENSLIRLDMSEYSEKSAVAKLHGSSAGYIGYDDGGVLTNAIKNKPYSVVLLDEIEKADESIHNLFLQVFDEGRISENNGNVIDCSNCIFIMTSNVGAKVASEFGGGVGFITDEGANRKSIYEKQVKNKFTPEFLNRLDKIVYFNSLSDEDLKGIVRLEIEKLNKRLSAMGHSIVCSDELIGYLHSLAISQKEYGARPIIRILQDNIEDVITDMLLRNDYDNGHTFNANYVDGKVAID